MDRVESVASFARHPYPRAGKQLFAADRMGCESHLRRDAALSLCRHFFICATGNGDVRSSDTAWPTFDQFRSSTRYLQVRCVHRCSRTIPLTAPLDARAFALPQPSPSPAGSCAPGDSEIEPQDVSNPSLFVERAACGGKLGFQGAGADATQFAVLRDHGIDVGARSWSGSTF
jgi:hypothetical protein